MKGGGYGTAPVTLLGVMGLQLPSAVLKAHGNGSGLGKTRVDPKGLKKRTDPCKMREIHFARLEKEVFPPSQELWSKAQLTSVPGNLISFF